MCYILTQSLDIMDGHRDLGPHIKQTTVALCSHEWKEYVEKKNSEDCIVSLIKQAVLPISEPLYT